ncbi:hypothetical protein HMPREF1583_00402 [Gardnerella vaginalis JCP8151B]|nr:hypothetical protein HMPREF1583_00402 [Gardnerella vaginalis JCP8151B]
MLYLICLLYFYALNTKPMNHKQNYKNQAQTTKHLTTSRKLACISA